MDRGAWQATVHRVTKVRHNLATKPPLFFVQVKMETQIHPWKLKIDLSLQEQGKEVMSTGEKTWGSPVG